MRPREKAESMMGFIMEFAENLILRLMEEPKERDRVNREDMERCKKTKEMWSLPLRPYGFWTFERHNAQLFYDASISQAPGRRDPYDDLLQDHYLIDRSSIQEIKEWMEVMSRDLVKANLTSEAAMSRDLVKANLTSEAAMSRMEE